MADFRDVVYLPGRAFLDGANPYDAPRYRAEYPAGNVFPLYMPALVVLAVPFALLPVAWSMGVYWALNLSLYVVLAAVCLRVARIGWTLPGILFLASAILVSTPGRANFNAGQVTLPIVLGALAGVYCSQTKPRWATIGLAIAMIKPTFGIPLTGLVLLRGHWQVALGGVALCAIVSLVAVAVIEANPGNRSILDVAGENQAALQADPLVQPNISHVRIDGLPLLVQGIGLPANAYVEYGWCLLIAILAGGTVVRHAQRKGQVATEQWTHALTLLATVICIYHLVYDALLLACPCVVALRRAWQVRRPQDCRICGSLGMLMIVPAVNILWSPLFVTAITPMLDSIATFSPAIRSGSWTAVATLNSLALVSAFFLCMVCVNRHGKS